MASTKIAAICLFSVLGCFVSSTVIYTVVTDGLPFRIQLLTPWMAATLIDFYINVFAIAAWVLYKENNWFLDLVWLILLLCFGSITTCAYITWQLLKLSSHEAAQDPIYHIILRQDHKCAGNVKEPTATCFSVTVARTIFIALGCLMLGTLIYTILTDGSPFRKELLTPWMNATLIDFYTNVIAISVVNTARNSIVCWCEIIGRPVVVLVPAKLSLYQVWVAYKESNWTSAFTWILILICTGSLGTCIYIVSQLFRLSSQDPVYLILINSRNRQV